MVTPGIKEDMGTGLVMGGILGKFGYVLGCTLPLRGPTSHKGSRRLSVALGRKKDYFQGRHLVELARDKALPSRDVTLWEGRLRAKF